MNMLEKIAFAAVLIGIACPSFARAEEAPAPKPKVDLALQRALTSPVDRHGIPQDLYDLDAELAGFRSALEQSESTAGIQGVGGGILIAGGVLAGLAAPDFVWAPFGVATGVPWGYAIAGLGAVVEFMCLGTMSGLEAQRKLLQDTYASRYPAGGAAGGAHAMRGLGSGGIVLLRW